MIECAVDVSSATGAPGRTVAYTYDGTVRLATAKTAGSNQYAAWGLSWTYDRFGNRWTQGVTAGTAPAVSLAFGPNGMNSSTTNQPNGYTYDANGNMTVEAVTPPNDLGYDSENRMTSFSGGGGSGTYVYDDNGFRVQKTAGGTSTVYIYSGSQDIAEYDNGAAPSSPSREFIYADGDSGAQLLARITGTTINYYHQDILNTVRLMTDSNGNDILDEGTFPFGENWYSNSMSANGEWIFTTYQHDNESGLDYGLARYYDSRMGAFGSADPVQGDPNDPQTWNRYAYARNNPTNLTDPTGKDWFPIFWKAFVIAVTALSGMPEASSMIILNFEGQSESGLRFFIPPVAALSQAQRNPQPAGQHAAGCTQGRQPDGSYRACDVPGSEFHNDKSPTGTLPASIGNGQCVTATARFTGVPPTTSKWQEGPPVVMANGEVNPSIPLYTAVATFDEHGHYFPNSDNKNSGTYLGGSTKGSFFLLDQWPERTDGHGNVIRKAVPPHVREITPNGIPPSDNSLFYYVIIVKNP